MKSSINLIFTALVLIVNSGRSESSNDFIEKKVPAMSQAESNLFSQLSKTVQDKIALKYLDNKKRVIGKEHLIFRQTYNPNIQIFKKEHESYQQGAIITVGSYAICNYASIQDAVNAASSGDTIRITNEFYAADDATFNINNKSLIIIGGFNHCGTSASVSGKTTLNGFGMTFADSIIELTDTIGGMNVTFLNLVILGGQDDSDDGGGIEITGVDVLQNLERIDLFIYYTDIFVNTSDNGGGIHATDANITISAGSRIQANSAVSNGGGVYCKNGYILVEEDALIGMSDGTLGNDADSDGNGVGNGGGLFLDNCRLDLDASDGTTGAYIIGNTSDGSGGGISAKGGSVVNLYGDKAWVNLNHARFDGGGIFSELSRVNIYNGSINGNSARDGAGIKITDETLVFQRDSGYPCDGKCNQLSENNSIRDGGALDITSSTATLDGLWIESNTATRHGFAIQGSLSEINVMNSMITNNVTNNANSGTGPIVLQGTFGTFDISYSTLAGNEINNNNALIDFIDTANININFDSNIFWNDIGLYSIFTSENLANVTFANNVIDGFFFTSSYGISADPEFFSKATNNFHITTASPAINFGKNTLNVIHDVDNESRGLQNTPDAGADEANLKVGIAGSVCEYATISDAIIDANDGDTLYISVGNYIENPGIMTKSLTFVQSNGTCTAEQNNPNSADVIIDGSNNYSSLGGVFNVASGKTITFKDLTIQNGKANFGGIIYANISSTLVLDNSVIKAGSANRHGGGIFTHGNVSLLNGSKVFSNSATSSTQSDAQSGGGISVTSNGSLTIDDGSLISDNIAVGKGGGIYAEGNVTLMGSSKVFANNANAGGGIYVNLTSLTLNDSSAIGEDGFGNNASNTGGGLYAIDSSVNINDMALIIDNSSQNGGGMYITGDSDLTMQINTEIVDNQATRGAGLYYLITNSVIITGGQFSKNVASTNGGGIYFSQNSINPLIIIDGVNLLINQAISGAALYYKSNNSSGELRINNSHINANTATESGGGLFIDNGSSSASVTKLSNSSVTNNIANNGAGAFINSATAAVSANFFIDSSYINGNNASSTGGAFNIFGGIIAVTKTFITSNNAATSSVLESMNSSARFTNVVMYGNSGSELFNLNSDYMFKIGDSTIIAETSTNLFNQNSDPATSAVDNTILSGFQSTTIPLGSLNANCVLDSTGAIGSTASPLFVDAANHDYHLQVSSNAINKCASGENVDYDSNPRPIGSGPIPYDIGAFEYQEIIDDDLIFANGFSHF